MTNPTNLRTDVHRPAEMDPTHYEYVGAADNAAGDPGARGGITSEYTFFGVTVTAFSPVGAMRQALETLVAQSDRLDRGVRQCHHCGAHIRYFAVLEHLPTGEFIAVGETCLSGRFSLLSKADFDRLRKAAELDRAKMRVKTAAGEFVEGTDGDLNIALNRETDLAATFGFDPEGYACRTITSIRNDLWNKYGSLTERQVAFVERLVRENKGELAKRAAIAAERAAEVKVPAPEGRIGIQGTVVSRKFFEDAYRCGHRLTVKMETPEGVWLANFVEPRGIEAKRGDILRCKVTLKRSDRDQAFAFGKIAKDAEIVGQITDEELDALAD